ncbi:MAG: hypothetical protein NXI32_14340 [bacterium]|nr:hypothetical protein [bacterium]
MPKQPLTAAEQAAYRELARAASNLRRAQEAAERKSQKLWTAAEPEHGPVKAAGGDKEVGRG